MPNDFLTSLSARALQNTDSDPAARGVMPRPVSRFESPTAHTLPAPEPIRDSEEMIQAEGIPAEETRRLSPLPLQDQAQTSLGHFTPSEDNQLDTPRLPTRDRVEPILVSREPGPEQTLKKEPTITGVKEPGVRVQDQRDVQSAVPQSLSVVRQLVEVDRSGASTGQDVHGETLSVDRSTAISSAVAAASFPTNTPKASTDRIEITHRETAVRNPGLRSQIVPAVRLPELKPEKSPSQMQAQPTINVTIGRIEVRATPSNPAPKRRPPAASTMSLEEYLRRRQGGER